MRHLLENNLKEKGSDLARVLAADSRVVQALEKGSDPGLRDYVQGICSRTDAAYMVVTDEHARRLSHPPELVGQTFRGGHLACTPVARELLLPGRGHPGPRHPLLRSRGGARWPGHRRGGGGLSDAHRGGHLSGADRPAGRRHRGGAGCGLLLALWVQHLLRRTLLDLEPETIANRFAQQDLVLEGISEG